MPPTLSYALRSLGTFMFSVFRPDGVRNSRWQQTAACLSRRSVRFLPGRGLGVVEYPVRIAVGVLGGEFIDAPRLLFRRGGDRHPCHLPIAVEGVDLGHRIQIEPHANGKERTFDHAIEEKSCGLT